MKFKFVLNLSFSVLFLLSIVYSAPISTCQTLNTPNTAYTLTTDIANHVGTCFTISANNVSLDCQGNTIDGDDVGSDYGIYVASSNFEIRNCEISDFNYGLELRNSYGVVDNVTTFSNTWAGLNVYSSSYTNFSNIVSENNNADGIGTVNVNSDFNRFENITIRNNLRYGIELSSVADSNYFNNITVVNNGNAASEHGLDINSPNNEFYNLKVSGSSGDGIYLTGSSNIVANSIFTGNSGDDIEVTSSSNSFYGNSISSSASITDLGSNFWNSSTPFVGNFYGDFGPCTANETRIFNGISYTVCTNPSFFDLGGGVFDYAPLASATLGNGSGSPPPPPPPPTSNVTTVEPSSPVPVGSLGSVITALSTLVLFFLLN